MAFIPQTQNQADAGISGSAQFSSGQYSTTGSRGGMNMGFARNFDAVQVTGMTDIEKACSGEEQGWTIPSASEEREHCPESSASLNSVSGSSDSLVSMNAFPDHGFEGVQVTGMKPSPDLHAREGPTLDAGNDFHPSGEDISHSVVWEPSSSVLGDQANAGSFTPARRTGDVLTTDAPPFKL